MGIDKIPTPLTPEEQEIADKLKYLAGEGNETLRNLCFGQGKESGYFAVRGITFRLLGSPGDNLQKMQMQIEVGDKAYDFNSWSNDIDGLAKEMVLSGLTSEQMDVVFGHIEDAAQDITS